MVSSMIELIKRRLGLDAPSILKNWINAKSDQGFTALHFASYRGNYEMICILIEEAAEIEVINNEGLNVLHMAAQGNQPLSLVFFKDKYKMNLMSVDDVGSTPLHWAAYTGSKEAFIYLLSWNVDVNAQDKEGLTPLHLAVISERTQLIKKLLQKGADKELKDSKNRDPITLAKEKNKTKIFEMLNDNNNCTLFAMNVPLKKLEKSNLNVYMFILLHIIVCVVVNCFNLPTMNSDIYLIVYSVVFGLVMLNFLYLVFSNPGVIKNEFNTNLMTLVQNNLKISDYCPTCVVKRTISSKHCWICNKCIDKFDHHCYWINGCVGGKNLMFFFTLLFLIIINLVFNIYISIFNLAVVSDKAKEDKEAGVFRKSSLMICINIMLLLLFLGFLLPLLYIMILNLKNSLNIKKKVKKNQDSELLLSSESMRDTTKSMQSV